MAEIKCHVCGTNLSGCLDCGLGFRYHRDTERILLSAKNWNGDDLLQCQPMMIVSGNVLEKFLNEGITGFAYGPCITDLAGMSPDMKAIAKKKSRKIKVE